MAPRRRSTRKQKQRGRITRKQRQGGKKVLDVRSKKMIANFENLLGRGPLTLVFIYADWCGACHRFRDEVWSPLTQLKDATMNRASIREDMIAGTSLANVERKFYPTLLLVGKDKKPATFVDENGASTPAMPRKPTLDEDKESLTALVNSPTPLLPAVAPSVGVPSVGVPSVGVPSVGVPSAAVVSTAVQEEMNLEASMSAPSKPSTADPSTAVPSTAVQEEMNLENSMERNSGTLAQPAYSIQPINSLKRQSQTPSDSMNDEPEAEDSESLGRSPFVNKSAVPSFAATMSSSKMPPDIGADLVASQNRKNPALVGGGKSTGSKLLEAIKNQTRSLKALLRLRTTRSKH
jgi:hypothetical protein